MKKADDILRDLGWELVSQDEYFIIYEWRNKYNIAYKMIFCLEQQCIEMSGYGMYETPFVRLKGAEIRAIIKKVKELRWKT